MICGYERDDEVTFPLYHLRMIGEISSLPNLILHLIGVQLHLVDLFSSVH